MVDWIRAYAVWVRLGVLGAILMAGVAVAMLTDLPSLASIRAGIADAGALGPVAFVLLYAGFTLAPLPKNVLSAAAGAVFGFGVGVLLVYVGALLGAAAAFWLGRYLGHEAVERLGGTRVERIDALLERRGLVAVLGLRLVPVVPFTALNYAAGLTTLSPRVYALGTALGIIPGTVSYVALGSWATDPWSWPFALGLAVLLLLSAAGFFLSVRSRLRRRGASVGPLGGSGDDESLSRWPRRSGVGGRGSPVDPARAGEGPRRRTR